MAQAVKKKIIVCGGNGFLGSRICRSAAARGWDVTSISRSGEPTWSSVTSSATPPPWSKSVTWHKANILQPATYNTILTDADAVIHSMGILLEADYKSVLQGKESPWNGLRRAFGNNNNSSSSSSMQGSQNPLEQDDSTEAPPPPPEKDSQITYELMNRDSAILLAKESHARSVPTFVYISAAAGAPVLPARYITTKRAAESTIATAFPTMRSIFVRPGFLYDASRSFTLPMAAVTGVGALANSLVGGRLTSLMGAGVTKPLKADAVADAVVEAVEDQEVKGTVEVPAIEELAVKAWRRGML